MVCVLAGLIIERFFQQLQAVYHEQAKVVNKEEVLGEIRTEGKDCKNVEPVR